ncbi:MAG: type II secretion system F family protein, partial [Acidimicrobiales bacterium]|nr:type II secretion system F family protein [Acidimicrobiales bacterium]
MLVLAIALLAAAIAVGVWTVAATADEKAVVRASLRQLDGYEVTNVRDGELLKPVRERTVQPLQERLVEIGKRFTPDGYTEKLRRKMTSAGIYSNDAVDRFIATRVVCIALVPVILVVVFGVLGLSGITGLATAGLLSFACVLGPEAVLDRKIGERQELIQRALPDVLDLLVISVEAGLGFEQALDRTVAAVPGPLTEEFARMLGEVRAGASRGDAMRAMDARCDVPELRSFVLAILQ